MPVLLQIKSNQSTSAKRHKVAGESEARRKKNPLSNLLVKRRNDYDSDIVECIVSDAVGVCSVVWLIMRRSPLRLDGRSTNVIMVTVT